MLRPEVKGTGVCGCCPTENPLQVHIPVKSGIFHVTCFFTPVLAQLCAGITCLLCRRGDSGYGRREFQNAVRALVQLLGLSAEFQVKSKLLNEHSPVINGCHGESFNPVIFVLHPY